VETLIWERFVRDEEEPLYRRALYLQQSFWLRRTESRLCGQAALVLVCSRADQLALQQLVKSHAPLTQIVPNGVDTDYFSAEGPAASEGHLFFTGSMDWAPNENAVLSFLDEIWPEVRRVQPEVPFYVVGRNPSSRLRSRHGRDGVRITGTVPDVRPYMRRALALLVPMRVGGGTRLKILEAFAARVPVVSTAIGIEGIDAEPGVHYLQAESATDFAEAVTRLKQDPGLGRSLAAAAGELATTRYSWDAVSDTLACAYADRFAP
jgi:glycosyltransferase involved in cell wall biosynthesis